MHNLEHKDMIRGIEVTQYGDRIFGNSSGRLVSEDTYPTDAIIDAYSNEYFNLAENIHENVQSFGEISTPILTKRRTPTTYLNGKPINYKTEYLVGSEQPEWITNYLRTRNATYDALLEKAIPSKHMGILFSLITAYREADLARRFLGDVTRKKTREPDAIIGNADRILGQISMSNIRTDNLKNSVKEHILHERQRNLRRQLFKDETTALGAIGILLASKTGVGEAQFGEKSFFQPLRSVAKLPSVIEQLVTKEKAGLSLIE